MVFSVRGMMTCRNQRRPQCAGGKYLHALCVSREYIDQRKWLGNQLEDDLHGVDCAHSFSHCFIETIFEGLPLLLTTLITSSKITKAVLVGVSADW